MNLKNIFSKQLPNMPKEYIARLVLDRRHRSVALVAQGGTLLGGITYRVFKEQVSKSHAIQGSTTFFLQPVKG